MEPGTNTPEALYALANIAVLPGWFLMAAAPRWRRTQLLAGVIWPLLLAMLYLFLFVRNFASATGDFRTLANLATLFQNPWVMLAGWVHFLCFDLFIGAWALRDSQKRGIPHWMMLPCLLLTLMMGPLGFASYWAIRFWMAPKDLEA